MELPDRIFDVEMRFEHGQCINIALVWADKSDTILRCVKKIQISWTNYIPYAIILKNGKSGSLMSPRYLKSR